MNSGYARAAVSAVNRIRNAGMTPEDAWFESVKEEYSTDSSRKKPCPKSTFLGLCQEGLVVGVPAGMYTKAPDNPRYAVKAVELLPLYEEIPKPSALWKDCLKKLKEVTGEAIDLEKKPNSQMHVVLALWEIGALVTQ